VRARVPVFLSIYLIYDIVDPLNIFGSFDGAASRARPSTNNIRVYILNRDYVIIFVPRSAFDALDTLALAFPEPAQCRSVARKSSRK